MTDQNSNADSASSPNLEVFRIINARLQDAVRREEEVDYRSARANRRTQTVGRVSLIAIALLTPPVFYLIWTLVVAMGVITERMLVMRDQMEHMQGDFQEVAVRIAAIDDSVSSITRHVSVIPPLEQRMLSLREDMGLISGDMGGIAPNVYAIDQVLGGVDHNVAQMNHIFGFINRDVFRMRKDVTQMNSPMRMIPFFGQ